MTVLVKTVMDDRELTHIYQNVVTVTGTDKEIMISWKDEGDNIIHTGHFCAGYGCQSFTYSIL